MKFCNKNTGMAVIGWGLLWIVLSAWDFSRHSIPLDEILSGGPAKDGIPAIDRPRFVPAAKASLTFLKDGDRIIALVVNGKKKAYPLKILNWHEIVNDRIGGRRVLIIGLFVNAIGIAAAGFSTSLWALGGFLLLAGAGNSVFHPADYALLSANIDKSRIGRAYSLHSLSGTAGFAVAPLVMLGLATLWNWRIALFIIGTIGIAAAHTAEPAA